MTTVITHVTVEVCRWRDRFSLKRRRATVSLPFLPGAVPHTENLQFEAYWGLWRKTARRLPYAILSEPVRHSDGSVQFVTVLVHFRKFFLRRLSIAVLAA